MESNNSKYHALGGSIARRVFFRTLFLASAISLVSLLRFLPTVDFSSLTPKTYVDCIDDSDSQSQNASLNAGSYLFQSRVLNTYWGSLDSINCKNDTRLTSIVITLLTSKRLLHFGANSLCIGKTSPVIVSTMQRLGFSSVIGLHKHPFLSLNKSNKIVCKFDFKDSSFDFVFSKDFDKVSSAALLVLEVERILKPGGIAALLVDSSSSVSSFLRSSKVVHFDYINEFHLVVFKKMSEKRSFFYNHVLPEGCASVELTKPLVGLMEPLVEGEQREDVKYEKRVSYLPKFVDVSSKKRLVYIDIGVRELVNENVNVSDWLFPPSYPIDEKVFNVYFVHYNASVLLSYVKRPRVTFIYHPGLAGGMVKAENGVVDGHMDPVLGEEEFDFLVWFRETVQNADFVVVKMNAGEVEMKFLEDVFESGAICFVHELFLGCSESENMSTTREGCMDIYKGLRSKGVYVHQWWWDAKLHQVPQGSHVQ